MAPATTLREAFQATNPQQSLPSGDPYYVDFTQARNSRATDYLRQMVENCGEGQHSPIAFSGHRGSGKSTELRQLEQALGCSCFMLYLDIVDFLDPLDVDYTDLFLLVCRQVLESLHEHGVSLSANLLHDVEKWFMEVTKETEESVKLSAGISTEAKAGAEIPFIARLLAKLTADAKAGLPASPPRGRIRPAIPGPLKQYQRSAHRRITSPSRCEPAARTPDRVRQS